MSNKSKLLIFAAVLALALVAIFVYFFMSESYDKYRLASDAFEKKNYKEAYMYVNQAIDLDKYNRKAIFLKPKIYTEMSAEDNITSGKNDETKGDKAIANGDLVNGTNFYATAFSHYFAVTQLASRYNESRMLMRQLLDKNSKVAQQLPDFLIKQSEGFAKDGHYMDAYNYLTNSPIKTPLVTATLGKYAYEVAKSKLGDIETKMKSGQEIPDYLKQDARHWVNNVPKDMQERAELDTKLNQIP